MAAAIIADRAGEAIIEGMIAQLHGWEAAHLNAVFIDTLADGPEELTATLLAEFERRGIEPGDA